MITYTRPYSAGGAWSALYKWFKEQGQAGTLCGGEQFLEFSDEATLLAFKQEFDL